ncbi:MAG: DUF58 domain-containing protein [Proteobacteria bacterium]|nr:DUF58 domain-containing protein [Pseudomonadota bacterium]
MIEFKILGWYWGNRGYVACLAAGISNMKMDSYYNKILVAEPANNPPYLTRRGARIVLGVIAASGFAVWAHAAQHLELAAFLAGLAASACLLMAWFYAKNLLIWRAMQTEHVCFRADVDKDTLYPGAVFEVQFRLKNSLPFALSIDAICWDYTQNLSVDLRPDVICAPKTADLDIPFAGKAIAIGHGHLFGAGMVLSDGAGIFRMENHIELNLAFNVYPKRPERFKTRNYDHPLVQLIQDKLKTSFHDGDLEIIRPWQNTDSIRQILWRGYARHLDMQTIERSHHQESSLLCLIDSGVYMRLTRPDKSCNLADCVEYLAECISLFETATIVTYDEYYPRVIARQQSSQQAFERLEKWLLDTLDWRAPSKSDPNYQEIWSVAATQLYRDFKLYKGVDFVKKSGKKSKIDLQGLIQWATADMASKALAKNDVMCASQILHDSYDKQLVSLVRQRCRMPQSMLMPENPVPELSRAMPLIQKLIRSQASQTFIWFSDFAMPVDAPSIRSIGKLLRASDSASLAVFMPMPRHALNFNWRKGELFRDLNRAKLGNQFDLLEMTPHRPKTNTVGVLPEQ